jgi:DNA modification methylase
MMDETMSKAAEQRHSNTLETGDYGIHSWYRFVLSYPPHLVRKYLSLFDLPKGTIVLDPFCGTGTTLVEAQKHGLMTIGVDAHPFAAFVSRVKTHWSISVPELRRLRSKILARVENEYDAHELRSVSFRQALFAREKGSYLGLSADQESLIPAGFVSAIPLKKLLLLRDSIRAVCSRGGHDREEFFVLALCHVVSNGAGNFSFGPEIYRTKPKEDYDVLGHFAEQTHNMLEDLRRVAESCPDYAESQVLCGDARDCSFLPDGINAVITSPPYPNEKDYTRTTRVESVLMGMINKKEELRSLKESLLRSNTRNVFVKDDDGKEIDEFDAIKDVCTQIEERRIELGKTSGFERLYHKVVAHYFGGMRKHLRSLQPHLAKHAKLAYVVGDQLSFLMVPVYTARLLSMIAEAEGYRVLGTDLWRERIGTKVRNARNGDRTVRVREEVLMLEKV